MMMCEMKSLQKVGLGQNRVKLVKVWLAMSILRVFPKQKNKLFVFLNLTKKEIQLICYSRMYVFIYFEEIF